MLASSSSSHPHGGGSYSATGATAGTGSQPVDVEMCFLAKISNARILTGILTGIHLKKDQLATMRIESAGIKFAVEESKVLMGTCLLQKDLFEEYKYKEPVHGSSSEGGASLPPDGEPAGGDRADQFKVNLSTLIDCLNIFGGGTNSLTSLQIIYKGYGNPLFLMLEENQVRTDCGLRTLETDGIPDYHFRAVPILNKAIMKSDCLKEALNELDWSSETLNILMSPDAPHFRLTTTGPNGSCQIDFPSDSKAFEAFQCTQTLSYSYKTKLVQPTVKALMSSTKTQLRINERGTLNLQHMYVTDNDQTSFLDFYVIPLEEEEEDMDA
jgi:cell cycle checkpoint protein